MGNLTVKESGEMVNIISPNVSNITSFKVHFSPRQEGSGDPSPDNVREITGWNGVEGYISNVAQPYSSTSNTLTAAIDWTEDVGTVYGGYVDLINGELVETWQLRQISELAIKKTSGTGIWEHRFDMKYWVTGYGYETSGAFKCLTDCFTLGLADHNNSFLTYVGNLSVYDDTVSTADEFKAKYGQNYVAYEIKSDLWQTHQLTPQQLFTLKGQNNFWSNADYVEIEYELTETFDIQKAKRKIILNQPHVESASGDLVTFDTDMKGKLKECKVYFSPVQEGEGDPSPDNVRNITGWNGVEGYDCGKNIFDQTLMKDQVSWNIIKIYAPSGTTFTMSTNQPPHNTSGLMTYFRHPDGTQGATNACYLNHPITKTANDKGYLEIIQRNRDGIDSFANYDYQIELGSEATLYESYQSNTINIDWTDDVGTVYGGYVDLVKGELVVTNVVETFTTTEKTSMTKNYDTTEDSIYFSLAPSYPFISLNYGTTEVSGTSVHAGPKNGKSNQLRIIYGDNWRGTSLVNTLGSNYYLSSFSIRMQKDIFNLSDEYTGEEKATAINNYLAEHPLQVRYTLKTPITYQLTPQQLITLRGTNNIYSNTNGQTEIKYWKH